MKTPLLVTTALAATLAAGMTFADDDCHDPVADWQPREVLRQQLEDTGWEVRRIKIDDGCYEVKGYDQHGNKIKAEYFPASLRLRKLKITFDEDAVIPDDLYGGDRNYGGDNVEGDARQRSESRAAPNSGIVSGRPSVRVE